MSIQIKIQSILEKTFQPSVLIISNESHKHSKPGHETHFNITLISVEFKELSRIKRHQSVMNALKKLFQEELYAVQLNLKTPEEWEMHQNIQKTPNCNHNQKN